MIIEKLLVFLVLVTAVPIAYTRHSPLLAQQLFHHDIIISRHHAYQTQDVAGTENQVDTQNQSTDIDVVDIDGNTVDTQNEQYQLGDNPDPEKRVMNITGNVAIADKKIQEVQHQQYPDRQMWPYPRVEAKNVMFKNSPREIRIVEVPGNDVDETTSKIEVDRINRSPKVDDIGVNRNTVDLPNHQYQAEDQSNPEIEIVDINGNNVDLPNYQYQAEDQSNSEIEIVDINGNNVDLPKYQYLVEDQRNHEIQVVNINGNTVDLSSLQYQLDQQNPKIEVVDSNENLGNTGNDEYNVQDLQDLENQVDTENNNSEIEIVAIDADIIDTQNTVNAIEKVQDQQYSKVQIVQYPKLGANKVMPRSSMSGIQIFEAPENDLDDTNFKIEEDTNNVTSETPPIVNDAENKVDGPLFPDSYEVCKTVKCKKLGKDFLKSLKKSVNPCDNFYKFACGGWAAANPRPAYNPMWNRFSMVEDLAKRRIKEILESKIRPSDIRPVKQAKKWYHSCIDTESLEKRGLDPIELIIMRPGGWPLTLGKKGWSENKYTWQRVQQYYARLTGSYVFYDIGADYTLKDNKHGQISIDAPKSPVDNKLIQPILEGNNSIYETVITTIAKSLMKNMKIPIHSRELYKEVKELLNFEKAITQLKQVNSSSYTTSFDELIDIYNSDTTDSNLGRPESRINWSSEIQDLFNLVNIRVKPCTNVTINNVGYVKGIGELLMRTPPRTIVNYIHWNFISTMSVFTTDKMRNLFSNRLLNKILGATEFPPRWSECIDEMQMKHAISYAFVNKYFTEKTASAAHQMIDNIRIALKQKIEYSNWLDPEAKALSKEKLNRMKTFIGFPDWYNNKTAVSNYYDGLTIGNGYFENNLNYMRFERALNLTRYVKPEPELVPFSSDDDTPITVNAFYDPDDNFAEFPAADFQYSFFDPSFPNNVNYGILGYLIGHEMGHAFDTYGITRAKDGEKTKLPKKVLRSYYERADCFVDQFDKYNGNRNVVNKTEWNLNDDNVNKSDGQRTAGENIADSTGLETVFEAYKKLSKMKNPDGEMRLPGLEGFTDDQLFFLSFAEMWCQDTTPMYTTVLKSLKDEHSVPELRVIGALSNTKNFAKAFNCPVGSPMNPTNKCNIWEKSGAKLIPPTRRKHHTWHKQWN